MSGFFSHEAGQARRQWLNELDRKLTDGLMYYGGPGMEGILDALSFGAQMSDAQDIADYTQASRDIWDSEGFWDTVGDSAALATAGAAVMLPGISNRLMQGFGDLVDEGVRAYDPATLNMGLRYTRPDGEDFRGWHKAPGRDADNGTLDNLTMIYPDDVYDPRVAANYYGHGGDEWETETIEAFLKAKGNPDAEVSVYRAVPEGIEDIHAGDWVTPNRAYAEMHGDSWVDDGKYRILEEKVRAGDLYTDANSIHEFGWDPAPQGIRAYHGSPLTDAQRQAQDILDLRAAGRSSEVTDDMMAAADDAYLFDHYPLPMDEASRLARAREMGFDTDVPLFHGSLTPHVAPQPMSDVRQYGEDVGTYNSDAFHGPGYYTTTSSRDASRNYADVTGPDVRSKIENRHERLTELDFDEMADEVRLGVSPEEAMAIDPEVSRMLAEINAKDQSSLTAGDTGALEDYLANDDRALEDLLYIVAKKSVGPTDGVVHPVYGRVSRAVRTKNPNSTFLETENAIPDPSDFLEEAGGDMDLAEELAVDAIGFGEPSGPFADVVNSLSSQVEDAGMYGKGGELAGDLFGRSGYEGLTAADIEHVVRNSAAVMDGIDYGVTPGGLLNEAYRAAGFDAIDLPNPTTTFSNMPNLEGTAYHRVFLDPTAVRSRFARFDPEMSHLRNLSAGAAFALPISLGLTQEEEEAAIMEYLYY